MKAVLAPDHFIVAASLAAGYTSPAMGVMQADIIGLQLNYTGAPVGTFQIQASLDQVNWTALYLTVNGTVTNSIAVPANTSPIFVDMYGSSAPFIRVVYAGTGASTLDGYLTYKRIGD